MKLRCTSISRHTYIFNVGGIYNVTHIEGRGTLYEVFDNFGTSRVVSVERLTFPASENGEVLATFEVVE